MDHDFSFLSTVCFYRHVCKWFLSVHQDKNFGAIEEFCIIRTGGPKKLGHIKKKLRFTGAHFNDIDNTITSLVKSDEICHICIQLANFRDIGLNHCLCDGTLRHFKL